MGDLYDRLRDQLGDEDDAQPTGLSPFDLLDLPEQQRKVVSFMLRGARGSGGEVPHRLLAQSLNDVDDLGDTLDQLVRNGWLIAFGEAPDIRYRVNFRSTRSSQLSLNLWSTLMDRLDDH